MLNTRRRAHIRERARDDHRFVCARSLAYSSLHDYRRCAWLRKKCYRPLAKTIAFLTLAENADDAVLQLALHRRSTVATAAAAADSPHAHKLGDRVRRRKIAARHEAAREEERANCGRRHLRIVCGDVERVLLDASKRFASIAIGSAANLQHKYFRVRVFLRVWLSSLSQFVLKAFLFVYKLKNLLSNIAGILFSFFGILN